MKTSVLKDQIRGDLSDPEEGTASGSDSDSLWKNTEIIGYINAAIDKFARFTLSIFDTFELPVVADNPYVKYSGRVSEFLDIERAYLSTARRAIDPANVSSLVMHNDYGVQTTAPQWESATGTPQSYLRDYRPGQLRLFPIPTANDTLLVTAQYVPKEVAAGDELPVRAIEDYELLKLWVYHLAYRKHDVDTLDLVRSDNYALRFTAGARERYSEAKRIRRVAGVVRPPLV